MSLIATRLSRCFLRKCLIPKAVKASQENKRRFSTYDLAEIVEIKFTERSVNLTKFPPTWRGNVVGVDFVNHLLTEDACKEFEELDETNDEYLDGASKEDEISSEENIKKPLKDQVVKKSVQKYVKKAAMKDGKQCDNFCKEGLKKDDKQCDKPCKEGLKKDDKQYDKLCKEGLKKDEKHCDKPCKGGLRKDDKQCDIPCKGGLQKEPVRIRCPDPQQPSQPKNCPEILKGLKCSDPCDKYRKL